MHSKELLYKKLSPNNLFCGSNGAKRSVVSLIDFSVNTQGNKKFTPFSSLTEYKNKDAVTPFDEIESMYFLLSYFLRKGQLWESTQESDEKKVIEFEIKQKKEVKFEYLFANVPTAM